ncbi:hypothetical protein [Arthrobacter crystallopoietes]|uniref:hypothetical protein n=1 Tax=Crystallibacter crystallopoietes TaxID=37928 RepID=UPI00094433AA|nr:hypothetical protein [Arthrobacter crystallopoietes]AUI50639.1 hypothetical protein AC20117_07165 [Arthrobacter crystallopoietes]
MLKPTTWLQGYSTVSSLVVASMYPLLQARCPEAELRLITCGGCEPETGMGEESLIAYAMLTTGN